MNHVKKRCLNGQWALQTLDLRTLLLIENIEDDIEQILNKNLFKYFSGNAHFFFNHKVQFSSPISRVTGRSRSDVRYSVCYGQPTWLMWPWWVRIPTGDFKEACLLHDGCIFGKFQNFTPRPSPFFGQLYCNFFQIFDQNLWPKFQFLIQRTCNEII